MSDIKRQSEKTAELEMRLQAVLKGQPVEACVAALSILLVHGAKHSGCSLDDVQAAIRFCWELDHA